MLRGIMVSVASSLVMRIALLLGTVGFCLGALANAGCPGADFLGLIPRGETVGAAIATPAPEPGISAVLVVPAEDPAVHAKRIGTAARRTVGDRA